MTYFNNVLFVLFMVLLYNLFNPSVSGKPTFSFPTFESITRFVGFRKREVDDTSKVHTKPYSGIRVRNDSLRMVYYHDQTIAIAEIGPEKLLLSCELIEVVDPKEANRALQQYSKEISRPLMITLDEMLGLMQQCEMLEEPVPAVPTTPTPLLLTTFKYTATGSDSSTRRNDSSAPSRVAAASVAGSVPSMNSTPTRFSLLGGGSNSGSENKGSSGISLLFSGIAPGTKWCGSGDIAAHYHDLGTDYNVDKCCRTHDICPVKIPKYQIRYNIYNDSPFTRSYCECDNMLYSCLKNSNSTSANIFGNIFFNFIQTTCIDQKDGEFYFRKNKNVF